MTAFHHHLSSLLLVLACWGMCLSFTPVPTTSKRIIAKIRPCPKNARAICHAFNNRRESLEEEDISPLLFSPFLDKSTRVTTSDAMTNAREKPLTAPNFSKLTQFMARKEESVVESTDAAATKKESSDNEIDTQTLIVAAATLFIGLGLALSNALGVTPADAVHGVEKLIANPQDTLQDVINYVQAMGPAGVFYFGVIYLVAEILAVPATPLTLSAGYLFGLAQGTAVVLLAATIAATVSFFIGKTFLRSWVESVLEENPDFAKIDRAIGKEGFRLLLLVRLSPIFPFALSNYLYGASSIDFVSYFFGTLLGFTPGTIAYIYTGMVGQALTLGGEGTQPWYVYAGVFAVLLTFLKLVTDVASNIVNAIDEEE